MCYRNCRLDPIDKRGKKQKWLKYISVSWSWSETFFIFNDLFASCFLTVWERRELLLPFAAEIAGELTSFYLSSFRPFFLHISLLRVRHSLFLLFILKWLVCWNFGVALVEKKETLGSKQPLWRIMEKISFNFSGENIVSVSGKLREPSVTSPITVCYCSCSGKSNNRPLCKF